MGAFIAFLVWRCIQKRNKPDSLFHWEDRSAISLVSTEDKFSPTSLAVTSAGRTEDPDRLMGTGWPLTNSPVMQQTGFTPGEMLPHSSPLGSRDYHPYAMSFNPPTVAESPISRRDNGSTFSNGPPRTRHLNYTAPSSAALPSSLGVRNPVYATSTSAAPSSLGAMLNNYAAPSSAALPPSPEDSGAFRTASHALSNHPNLLSVGSGTRASRLQRNMPGASTPSSLATTGSRRKQMGVALPPTSAPPSSVLSEERLRQMRMIVEGRPQDWGPIVSNDSRSEARTTLPPAYAQVSISHGFAGVCLILLLGDRAVTTADYSCSCIPEANGAILIEYDSVNLSGKGIIHLIRP